MCVAAIICNGSMLFHLRPRVICLNRKYNSPCSMHGRSPPRGSAVTMLSKQHNTNTSKSCACWGGTTNGHNNDGHNCACIQLCMHTACMYTCCREQNSSIPERGAAQRVHPHLVDNPPLVLYSQCIVWLSRLVRLPRWHVCLAGNAFAVCSTTLCRFV